MAERPVHWYEGMFLRPHHFQLADRFLQQTISLNEKWDCYYNWGLRAFELDLDALANNRFVVRSLKARLRDGTLISIPEESTLSPLDLKAGFESTNALDVFLALPVLNVSRPNVSENRSTGHARYIVETQDREDENTGINAQPMQLRMLNLKLLLSTDDLAGFEVLPIARIEKSQRAEAFPQLDASYIPPVLSCDAWKVLNTEIVQVIYDRLGKKIDLLSSQVVSRGITFDSRAQGDQLLLTQLRQLNEAYALLAILGFAQGVHPFPMYVELCRIVGQLGIFSASRRPPEVLKYDHDDLGGCFYQVKRDIDALLDILVEPDYKERSFIGAGRRMQVALEPAWLESASQMFVGVQSPLEAEECIKLLTKSGQLDMKIGSSERVDEIFRLGQAGLKFAYTDRPPRNLPHTQGLIYFQVSQESQHAEWENVRKSLTLAIRLNEGRIAGDIQGQRVLKIKTGGQTTTLQFTLYVIRTDSQPPKS